MINNLPSTTIWYRFTSTSLLVNPTGEINVYPSVTRTGWLLQPIQFSFEYAHIRLTVEDLETFRMLYVHQFLNDPIEK